MFEYPRGRKKILATIRRYERLLEKEQRETGWISDGFGKRALSESTICSSETRLEP
jgi:hypothetical protein